MGGHDRRRWSYSRRAGLALRLLDPADVSQCSLSLHGSQTTCGFGAYAGHHRCIVTHISFLVSAGHHKRLQVATRLSVMNEYADVSR